MPAIVIVALAVFFIWEAVLRPLFSYATDRSPDVVDNIVKAALVLLTVWLVNEFVHGTWLFVLAAGGLVALFSAGLRRLEDPPPPARPDRRLRGVPRPGG